MESFKKLGLGHGIVQLIKESGFTEPTDVQAKAIPLVLDGKDVLGSSATGSGKTLAFGAGIIERMESGNGIQCLVLTPTRELADQVAKSLRHFSSYKKLVVSEIYGGVSIEPQKHALRRADIVVGTPGRILDHLNQRSLDLTDIKYLVLDEADRMLDMGFIDDVVKIIEYCPKERQTLLFSATISHDIERISKHYMREPVAIESESQVDPSKLHQVFYDVQNDMKFSLLVHLLKEERSGLVMVFCNTRKNADYIVHNLQRNNLNAVAIHGGLTQNKRTKIMQDFHSAHALILVCTDVAARGLDIKGVSHVYNYDSPKTSTEYIHRIGRTARAGKEGIAITLVSQRDYENFRKVCADPALTIQQKEILQIERVYVKFRDIGSGYGNRFGGDRRGFGHGRSGERRGFGGGSRFGSERNRGGFRGSRVSGSGRHFDRGTRGGFGGRGSDREFGGNRERGNSGRHAGRSFGGRGQSKGRRY